mgnify:CR=1 FL=1
MNWIIENDGFTNGDILLPALKTLNKPYKIWNDEFWNTKEYESFPKNSIFHGSLGNASKIKKELNFLPGSLCDEIGFSYSYIYENYKEFVDNDMYYVDKTLLIRDIMEKGGKVKVYIKNRNKMFR